MVTSRLLLLLFCYSFDSVDVDWFDKVPSFPLLMIPDSLLFDDSTIPIVRVLLLLLRWFVPVTCYNSLSIDDSFLVVVRCCCCCCWWCHCCCCWWCPFGVVVPVDFLVLDDVDVVDSSCCYSVHSITIYIVVDVNGDSLFCCWCTLRFPICIYSPLLLLLFDLLFIRCCFFFFVQYIDCYSFPLSSCYCSFLLLLLLLFICCSWWCSIRYSVVDGDCSIVVGDSGIHSFVIHLLFPSIVPLVVDVQMVLMRCSVCCSFVWAFTILFDVIFDSIAVVRCSVRCSSIHCDIPDDDDLLLLYWCWWFIRFPRFVLGIDIYGDRWLFPVDSSIYSILFVVVVVLFSVVVVVGIHCLHGICCSIFIVLTFGVRVRYIVHWRAPACGIINCCCFFFLMVTWWWLLHSVRLVYTLFPFLIHSVCIISSIPIVLVLPIPSRCYSDE